MNRTMSAVCVLAMVSLLAGCGYREPGRLAEEEQMLPDQDIEKIEKEWIQSLRE